MAVVVERRAAMKALKRTWKCVRGTTLLKPWRWMCAALHCTAGDGRWVIDQSRDAPHTSVTTANSAGFLRQEKSSRDLFLYTRACLTVTVTVTAFPVLSCLVLYNEMIHIHEISTSE